MSTTLEPKIIVDIIVSQPDPFSILIVSGHTENGKQWVEDSLAQGEHTRWADGIAVEMRYIGNIVQGAIDEGLVVANPRGALLYLDSDGDLVYAPNAPLAVFE